MQKFMGDPTTQSFVALLDPATYTVNAGIKRLICGAAFGATAHDDAHGASMTLPHHTRTERVKCSRWCTDRSRSLFSLVPSRDCRREHAGLSLFAHALLQTSAPFLRWEEDRGRHTCTCAQEMGGLVQILTSGLSGGFSRKETTGFSQVACGGH